MRKQDEMEKLQFNLALKFTVAFFFIALSFYNFYQQITFGEMNIVWIIQLVGLIIFFGILTYYKLRMR
ncbi:hypothetical protein K0017_02540 [Staphylococcus massiliensis]|uniref:hypothetical protein n=1 Tax=Staphylococcus massiliensis TaxID=555791 RepID=UPI001EDE0D85|nr:hypothetical protein [Staphylococcus massiliensis]MCG3401192.1 hypothetical protein [Staphylococcus massiliensis]